MPLWVLVRLRTKYFRYYSATSFLFYYATYKHNSNKIRRNRNNCNCIYIRKQPCKTITRPKATAKIINCR